MVNSMTIDYKNGIKSYDEYLKQKHNDNLSIEHIQITQESDCIKLYDCKRGDTGTIIDLCADELMSIRAEKDAKTDYKLSLGLFDIDNHELGQFNRIMITHENSDFKILDVPTRAWYHDLKNKPDRIGLYSFRYNIELKKGEHLVFYVHGIKNVDGDPLGKYNEPDIDICKDNTKFRLECDKFTK